MTSVTLETTSPFGPSQLTVSDIRIAVREHIVGYSRFGSADLRLQRLTARGMTDAFTLELWKQSGESVMVFAATLARFTESDGCPALGDGGGWRPGDYELAR